MFHLIFTILNNMTCKAYNTCALKLMQIYTVSWKTWCRIFAMTSSNVYWFWKFDHSWIQQWIIYKINIIFHASF